MNEFEFESPVQYLWPSIMNVIDRYAKESIIDNDQEELEELLP